MRADHVSALAAALWRTRLLCLCARFLVRCLHRFLHRVTQLSEMTASVHVRSDTRDIGDRLLTD